MTMKIKSLFCSILFFVLVVFQACNSTADRNFDFNYQTDFMVNEYEIYEGVPATLANLSFGDALAEALKKESTNAEKLHDVTLRSIKISFSDTAVNFSNVNNFKLEIFGSGEKVPMQTIASASDIANNAKEAEMKATNVDLVEYFKDPKLLFILSAEGKTDIEDAFGMKIEMNFNIGVKN